MHLYSILPQVCSNFSKKRICRVDTDVHIKTLLSNAGPASKKRNLNLLWQHRKDQILFFWENSVLPVLPSSPWLRSLVASWDFGGICQDPSSTERNTNRCKNPQPLHNKQKHCSTSIQRKNTAWRYIHYFSNKSVSHHDIIVFKNPFSVLAQGLTGNESSHSGFQGESFGRFINDKAGASPSCSPEPWDHWPAVPRPSTELD